MIQRTKSRNFARAGLACGLLLLAALAAGACRKETDAGSAPLLTLEARPATASPGPPTTLRLVLRLEKAGQFTLLSATPRRGSIRQPNLAERRQDLLAGRLRLVEYTALDPGGLPIGSGLFTVPVSAVSEFQDLNVETRVRRREEPLTDPVVKISIVYRPEIAAVAFQGLEPDAKAETQLWRRLPMGQVSLAETAQKPSTRDPRQEP
jgi:hypothetical protein